MSLMEYRHGALAVIEQAQPKDAVQRELKRLDDRLFLERQVTIDEDIVWCVVVDIGLGHPPVTILEWRDESGRPIPYLSSRLVSRVAAMDRDGAKLTARVIEHNARLVRERKEQSRREFEEIAADMIPRMSGTRSAALPRGQHLRRSRDARRARGESV